MDKDATQFELYKHFFGFFLPEGMQDLRPNGFTEETVINDFPVRDKKFIMHVRRRRWLTPDGKNVVLNVYPLAVTGTHYSAEFAAFLKDTLGRPVCWGVSI